MNGAPLQGWAQIALAIIALLAIVGGTFLAFALRARHADRYVARHNRATGFLEPTGDIPTVITAPEFAPEPYDLAAALDIENGTTRLDLIEVELERIEWDGFVHDHYLDDFFARVDEVEAAARVYRDALLAHLIGAAA